MMVRLGTLDDAAPAWCVVAALSAVVRQGMKHPYERSLCRPQAAVAFEAGGASYVLHGKLGNGAVGIVRKARKRGSDRPVAVKFLAPDPKYIEISAFDEV